MVDKYSGEVKIVEDGFMKLYKNFKTEDWKFFNEDEFGSKVYKRDSSILIKKPIRNLFAEEITYQFWNIDKKFKMSWDESIEDIKLIKMIDDSTAILHVIFKSVLLVSKRDIVMYSKIKQIDDNTWIVINHSLKNFKETKDIVRISLDVVMLVKQKGSTRDDVECEMFYYGDVNLKGWLSDDIVKYQCGYKWPQVLENLCKSTRLSLG